MRIITIILVSLFIILTLNTINAQETPTPPEKPLTVSVHSDGESSYSYSVSSSDDDGSNQSTNVSVSISNSDDSYSFRAKYSSSKNTEIRVILEAEMNRNNLTENKGKYIWISESDDEEVYKVVLSDSKLTMHLDKDIASSSLIKKFENLGKTLRTIIAGPQNDHKREAERIQREADRLRRDAERMQREAERMRREAERREKEISRQYKDDARRIAEEARRLADEARHLNTEAAHKGGVSEEIKTLLGNVRTAYDSNLEGGHNWYWPKAQGQLTSSLVSDGLVSDKDDINFNRDESGTYVNGKKVSYSQEDVYEEILSDNGIPKVCEFRWYKQGQHIVLVNSNADLDGFIADGVKKGLLSSAGKKVKLQINGSSILKDGAELSASELSDFNELLLKNNIIPAPGKIFEIMRSGAFKVGYSLGDKAHLGTWSIQN